MKSYKTVLKEIKFTVAEITVKSKKEMILDELLENRDEKYVDFNARLIPTIERSKILGVRMPILRKITKSRYTELEENGFLKKLPHREETLRKVDLWSRSECAYTVRFAISVLMQYFLDKEFNDKYLEKVARIENDDYYVKMMQAWYFATALTKQWKNTISYLEQKKLSIWVHNKTIQKAIERRRISAENKKYLKALKIKD